MEANAQAVDILKVVVASKGLLLIDGSWKTLPTCNCLDQKDLSEGNSPSITVASLLPDRQPCVDEQPANFGGGL